MRPPTAGATRATSLHQPGAIGGFLLAAAVAVVLAAGAASAQDTAPFLDRTLPGHDEPGALVEAIVVADGAAIGDVEIVDGLLTFVLDGDRVDAAGPTTFSLRDEEILRAFDRETVPVRIVTRIQSESPGVGAGTVAQIETPFNITIDVEYRDVVLVVEVRVGDAVTGGELEAVVSNGGTVDLADVVVLEGETTICPRASMPSPRPSRHRPSSRWRSSSSRSFISG